MTELADSTPERRDDLWPAVNAILANASPEGIRTHALGPLEAFRRDLVGAAVTESLVLEARMAAFAMLSVRPLLERARHGCDGPLVLMKGPELALRYPGRARGFTDIDLLTPEPARVHDQLRAAGFVEDDDAMFVQPLHHLRPLKWPELPLKIEIHGQAKWPDGLRTPTTASVVRAARPSRLGVHGILTPDDAHHALLVAAHAWAHEPLWRLRDLVDVRALAAPSERAAIEQTARAWGMTRLWRTTDNVTDAVLGRRELPLLVRPWARHLLEQRERTVFEAHLRDLAAAFWALPPSAALQTTVGAIREDVLPAHDQGWSDKLSRMLNASKNANTAMSQHSLQLEDESKRGDARRRTRRNAGGENDDFN